MAYNIGGGVTGALGGAGTGAAIGSVIPGIGTAIGAGVGGLLGLFGGFGGKEKREKIRQQSLLGPEQQALYQQAIDAGLNPGAGGAFGESADYYRNNLSDNPADFEAFAAPEKRFFNEQYIPQLAEQFAGMGAGNLSSSGFRNAAVNAGTDLSERLGAIRANLRQQSAQGLSNIGQIGLGHFNENLRDIPQAGFMQNIAEGVGNAIPSLASSFFNRTPGAQNVGKKTSPYGGPGVPSTFNTSLPNFNPNFRG